jgi:hypothetical protein
MRANRRTRRSSAFASSATGRRSGGDRRAEVTVGVKAEGAGRLSLGGDGSARRTGYGAMQLPGLPIA